MKYIDKNGHVEEVDSGQDKILRFFYSNAAGRFLLKGMVRPSISKTGGWLLNRSISKIAVRPFVKKNRIELSQFEKQEFHSYNDFFKRKMKAQYRPIDMEPEAFISPCDGKLSVYPISDDSYLSIKYTEYNLKSLLRSEKLAKYYEGGYAFVFRLTVDDYHRFCYIDDGKKSRNYRIPGVFHTVNPVANDVYPIYKENTREFSLLKSKAFGTVLMMEVGALMVGRIQNHHEACDVVRGQEKGCFEFGGSTVVVLVKKGRVEVQERILHNTAEECETIVRMGERVGRVVSVKE